MRISMYLCKALPTRRQAFWGGEALTALIVGGLILLAALQIQQRYQEIQEAREQAIFEARREALLKEVTCMQLTLFWESKRHHEDDMREIARNIMTRVNSPDYPDSVCGVVNEVRKNAAGRKVAMYSYIFDNRPAPDKRHPDWRAAGKISFEILAAHRQGNLTEGAMNYHAPYVSPRWAALGVERCELIRMDTDTYHLFYAAVETREEKAACRSAQVLAAAEKVRHAESLKLPKRAPRPLPRPAEKDELAKLILAATK